MWQDIQDNIKKLNKKLLNDKFFRMFQRVAKYVGEPVYMVHDRYTIKDLGIIKGMKWVELSNCNACTPFHSIVIGVKVLKEGERMPKKWWKSDQEYVWYVTEEGEEWTTTHFTDSNLAAAFIIKDGENPQEVIRKRHLNYSFIRPYLDSWMIDCPDWVDRYGILSYLGSCLEVFSRKKNYVDYM